ncbi:MAG: thioredoxin [Bacteroidaceae bacterium]|nr:thioredoxin [Bacteroidaceae bacterium]
MVTTVTNENFKELLSANQLLVVDFWAEWCGPCKKIGPLVDELSDDYAGKICVAKCNVEDADEVASELGIRNIPTLLFFKEGVVVDKQVGATDKKTIAAKMDALL